MFTPRNVSQLMVGNGTSRATFALLSAVGDYAVLVDPVPGAGIGEVANKSAKLAVKTNKGYKVSDTITAANLTSYKSTTLAAATLGAVDATIPTPVSFVDKTFYATINVNDHIGSMLNERFMSAYVSTDSAGYFFTSAGVYTAGTINAICTELRALLASTVLKQGGEYTISGGTDHVIVTEKAPNHVVGVTDGIALPFTVTAGYKFNEIEGGVYTNVPAALAVTASKPSDLVQLKNVEWFNSGYGKDPYREAGYPYSFAVDSEVTTTGVATGNTYGIFEFFKDRDATNIERQHRQLIVVGAAAAALKAALDELVD